MTSKNLQARKSVINIYLSTCFSFLFAVLLTNIYEQGFVYIFLLAFLVAFSIIFYFKKLYFLVLISLIWMFFWYLISLQNIEDVNTKEQLLNNITSNFSKNVEIIWKIDWTEWTNEQKQYIISLSKIQDKWVNVQIILKSPSGINLSKWSIIKAKIKILEVKNTWDFDYKTYLKTRWILWQASLNSYTKIWEDINIFNKSIENIRNSFLQIIWKIYPDPYSGLLAWILIWEKSWLTKEIKTDFTRSWLSHIIAVSGFNITIMIVFLSFFIKFLPWYLRLIIISFFIISFYLIVWENIPALRASVMWMISYFAIVKARKLENFNVLMAIIIAFVILNPFILNYDISFHLSFLATLWVMYAQWFFNKVFVKVPEFLSIKESLVMTSSALAFTIPIMLVNFGQLSTISPIANILVAPAIPLSMLFWFLSIIFYSFSNVIWIIIWFIWWLFLKFMILVAHFSASISFSVVEINMYEYKYLFETIYYIILIFLIIYFKEERISEV